MTWRYRPEDFEHGIITEVEKGHYEKRIAVRPGDRVIDGGAQIGWFTKQIVDRAESVICFEPNPYNFEVLMSNLRAYDNHVAATGKGASVIPYSCALWDSRGVIPFYVHYKHPGAGGVFNFGAWRTKKVVQVRAMPLDECPLLGGPVHFIKLDVEKAELHALRGAQETLRRWRPVVVMETHPPAGEGDEIHFRAACVAWWKELHSLMPPDYVAYDVPERDEDTWKATVSTFVPRERDAEVRR